MKESKAFPLGSRMDLMHVRGMPYLEVREHRSGTFPLKYENLFSEQEEEIFIEDGGVCNFSILI